MTNTLTIVRGLPGSGKTTLAHMLVTARRAGGAWAELVEADDYFMRDGGYRFDPSELPAAHADCQRRTRQYLELGAHVYVANTFTQRWEYAWYLDVAKELGVAVQVVEVHSDFGSVHNVPVETMTRMRNRWEAHT
jgi:predicted kinase